MTGLQTEILEFGDYRIDTAKGQLLASDGVPISLTPKVFQTLLYLVQHGGRVIDKAELMEAIWPDTIVEENNLNQNISTLRRVLGDTHGQHHYIATVSGRGYRFVPEVTTTTDNDPRDSSPVSANLPTGAAIVTSSDGNSAKLAAPVEKRKRNVWLPLAAAVALLTLGGAGSYIWYRQAKPASSIKSLAVLPFKPLVADQRDESLEMGMAETLISRLSHNREIVVRPLSSVRRYTNLDQDPLVAGRELSVESVLEGHIQMVGDRTRVTVRLMRVGDGQQLWAGQFDEKFTDIFAVQDAISERVASALALQLTGDEQKELKRHYTENAEAYQLYLYGRFYRNKRTEVGSRTAIEYFEKAIAKDPNYALAYSGLSESYIGLSVFGSMPPKEVFPKAYAAALKALELDDGIAESHVAMAHFKAQSERDWDGAEKEYRRAIELNPQYADAYRLYAILLMEAGRTDEAFAKINRALEIDPTSVVFNATQGFLYYWSERNDQAIGQLKKTIDMDPGHWLARYWLAQVYAIEQRPNEALFEAEKALELSGDSGASWLRGYVFASMGRDAEAQREIDELLRLSKERYVPPYDIAQIYAGLGDPDSALSWLEKAEEDRSRGMDFLSVNPIFYSLRSYPRFAALKKKLGRA